MQMNDEVKRFLKWYWEWSCKRYCELDKRKRIVGYCVGLTFIAGISALIVYAGHG
jgi:hypothetical protein